MKNFTTDLPAIYPDWFAKPIIKNIIHIFTGSDFETRFVGGAVRDTLLKLPISDIDACTNATPDEMIEIFAAHNVKTIPTGIDHGTITVVMGDETIEITTLRTDMQCDGRHATVEFTANWQQDASRRDFTINALYLDKNGKIYDYFDGLTDLSEQKIKFIGNANDRITEDYLTDNKIFQVQCDLW